MQKSDGPSIQGFPCAKVWPEFGQTRPDNRLKNLWQSFRRKLADLAPGPLVIGLSGGLDSCCLLHLLYLAHNPHKNPIYPCYVQHGIRDCEPEAAGLPQFCQNMGLVLACWRIQPGWLQREAKRQSLSLEDLARRERYRRLGRYAQQLAPAQQAGTIIVLAHHADDQAESFFMNLARGAGPGALAGMKEWSQRPSAAAEVWLWRPLLEWQRRDLQAWAQLYSLPHWEDLSNFNQGTLRNFYRWQVLPQLKRMLPGLLAGMRRSQQHIALVEDWLEQQRQALQAQLTYVWETSQTSTGQVQQRVVRVCWPGDFSSLAPPLQVELILLLFDCLRAGEQRRRRLPLGFVVELQRQWQQHCLQGRKKPMLLIAHRCRWQLGCDSVTAEICL